MTYTHALVATWNEQAYADGITYGQDRWCADISLCRLRLEREANRRNADRTNYAYTRYYVEPI